MKKASLADLARALDVSKTLVSLVMNGHADENGISKATQKKVFEMAKKMNYKPNQFARSLRLGKSNTIGLIVADISNPFYASVCRSIEDISAKYDYHLVICSSDENPDREKAILNLFVDRHVDGIVAATTLTNSEDYKILKDEKIPFVLFDRDIPGLKSNKVMVNNTESSKQAVALLLKNGFNKTGLLTIGPSHLTPIINRKQGYLEAFEEQHIKTDPELIKEVDFHHLKSGVRQALDELLEKGINGLFIANNKLTLEVLSILKEKRIKIPEDIAIVSFDDRETFSLIEPGITAVSQPKETIGHEAMKLLLEDIKNKNSFNHMVQLSNKLIIRESCGSKKIRKNKPEII